MTMLVDTDINNGLADDPPLASGVPLNDFQSATSKVQAASLNLTIGDIFVPGVADDKPGGAYTPAKQFTLNQGHTAVIKTAEILNLGPKLAGIAFPPARVSLKGLLMTNPGHVDPGYRGPLHVTVINMSREPFQLRAGDRIMRVLFFNLRNEPAATFDVRNPAMGADVITPTLLNELSVDFLDVERRAKKIAKAATKKAAIYSLAIPIVVAIISVLATLGAGWVVIKQDEKKLDTRLTVVEGKQSDTLEARIRKLEDALATLNANRTTK
jgi:deoxycytidine triphosphate deaminase